MSHPLHVLTCRRGFATRALTFALLLAGLVWIASSRRPFAAPTVDVSARVAQRLAESLPERHLSRLPFDAKVAADAVEIFLSSVDFDRTVFLQSDVAEFRARAETLAETLASGDISLAFDVFERLKDRLANRVAFAEKRLAEVFDFERSDTYQWRRREAPWPADEKEWDDLWERKLQHELLARKVAMRLAEEDASQKKPDAEPSEFVRENGADAALTPGEFVLKRHRQYLILLRDSDQEWILDRFFSSFTRAYDPHSEYMSPVRSEDFDIHMRLSLVGIGAMLSTEDGTAKIERLLPGGPAERDGRLRPGDRIVAISQGDEAPVEVLHWPLYRVVRLIRGERGTKVGLTIWPSDDISGATERRIDLVRDEVKLEERAATGDLREFPAGEDRAFRFGILRLPEFYADFRGMLENGEDARRSGRDVRRILEDFRRENADGVILDLRRNGGGSLPDAIEIAGLFIESGPVVQVRDERRVQIISDPDPDIVYAGPLVVLVDKMSASASEIVAAALQDYKRAVIVGDHRTHGKGTVQSVIPLARNNDEMGQLKVTTATFYRIAGGSTQLKGVEADIPIPSAYDALEVGEYTLPHALPWTRVNAAFYAVFSAAIPPINELRLRSEARRAEHPEFIRRNELIEQIAQRVRSETISLNLEERFRLARTERELDRLQRNLDEETDEDENTRADLVLQESMQILAEIISPPVPAAVAAEAAAEAPMTEEMSAE